MEAPPVERRLAAILAADVEAYSRLMHGDEEATMVTLSARRALVDELIGRHRGRIANTAGDSVLAEVASVLDAVHCAVEIQEALAGAHAGEPDGRQMLFRIGVNVGDVMFKEGDIFGDGVNVAARLEGLVRGGEICVSRALCCTDRQLGEVSPPHRHLFEANVFRPPKLQHTVERRDSNGHLGSLPPFGPRAQRVTNHSLVAADIGFYQGTPIVTRCPLPAHAAALGDQLQVPVALGRRGLCRGAWHRARTWRHNDRRIGMTLADLTVDIVPIVRSIAGKRHNRSRDLLKQGTDLRTVIDILAGPLGGDDLSRVGIHPDMELSPGPTRPCGVLLDEPLTGTAELEPCAVHQQVYRFAARWWSRHRQCLAASAHRRMVWRREIKTQQWKNGCDQPFGLA